MAENGAGGALAPLIAIVGCDGSGKSTLARDLCLDLARTHSVEMHYLGLGSGAIGERIKRWPLIGSVTERVLSNKARRTRTEGDRIPGLATALVVYGFSLLRRRRFRAVLAARRAGVIVVTDRYPQTEVPGFYDGPGLSAASSGSRAVARLAAREARMYAWMASFRPDLVIRLDVDLATAHARKPDHDSDLLRRKIAATPLLGFAGAAIVDIDARAPYAEVRRQAWAALLPVVRDVG
ncbi:hypothetical protein [Sphingomonas sp.]|uniref:hypothetical protein n=1 Tax=Sphingomonas sp. TaxID=28214 RepID=UPI0035BC1E41